MEPAYVQFALPALLRIGNVGTPIRNVYHLGAPRGRLSGYTPIPPLAFPGSPLPASAPTPAGRCAWHNGRQPRPQVDSGRIQRREVRTVSLRAGSLKRRHAGVALLHPHDGAPRGTTWRHLTSGLRGASRMGASLVWCCSPRIKTVRLAAPSKF